MIVYLIPGRCSITLGIQMSDRIYADEALKTRSVVLLSTNRLCEERDVRRRTSEGKAV
jgi:hypothetical protein